MRFFIRADANINIGMGHVMRCLSIADPLKTNNHKVTFLLADEEVANFIQNRDFSTIVLHSDYRHMDAEITLWPKEEKADAVIVDSYFVTLTYFTFLKNKC